MPVGPMDGDELVTGPASDLQIVFVEFFHHLLGEGTELGVDVESVLDAFMVVAPVFAPGQHEADVPAREDARAHFFGLDQVVEFKGLHDAFFHVVVFVEKLIDVFHLLVGVFAFEFDKADHIVLFADFEISLERAKVNGVV